VDPELTASLTDRLLRVQAAAPPLPYRCVPDWSEHGPLVASADDVWFAVEAGYPAESLAMGTYMAAACNAVPALVVAIQAAHAFYQDALIMLAGQERSSAANALSTALAALGYAGGEEHATQGRARLERALQGAGHYIGEWHEDSPSAGGAWAHCTSCGGTFACREDGSLATPIERCPDLVRAEAEQREGISDYIADAGDGEEPG
jgi:hypothetical protein